MQDGATCIFGALSNDRLEVVKYLAEAGGKDLLMVTNPSVSRSCAFVFMCVCMCVITWICTYANACAYVHISNHSGSGF